MLRVALGEPSVETGLVEELVVRDADPLAVLEAFYRTGKIPHRIAALRALSRSSLLDQLKPAPGWLRDAALDADFQVRELALGLVRFLDRTEATPLVRAALLDLDPELNHVAVRAAVAGGLTNLVTEVVKLLDDGSLNVRIAAASALRQWSGQDFGVRRSLLGGAYNDLSSEQPEVSSEALARVQTGIEQWKAWWAANNAGWPRSEPPPPAEPAEGLRPAPDFVLLDLNGNPVRLSQFRGRPVFVNFWATWCTACWPELPELVKLQNRHGDGLVILGISLDGLPDQHALEHGHEGEAPAAEGDEKGHALHPDAATPRDELVRLVAGYAKLRGINYPVLLDPEGDSSLVYQGNELPVNVLVDSQGYLRRRFVGPRSPEVFDAMIAELTGARH